MNTHDSSMLSVPLLYYHAITSAPVKSHYYQAAVAFYIQLMKYRTRFGTEMPLALRDTLWQDQIDHFDGKEHSDASVVAGKEHS